MGTFKKALTPEEEQELLIRLAEGDEEAKQSLVEHNLRLVIHIAKKFANTGTQMDELISTGTIGLIKAVDKFDPKRQSRLATFAATCIENEILMSLRAGKKDSANVLLSDSLGVDDDGNELTYKDVLVSQQDDAPCIIEMREGIWAMCKAIAKVLNETERNVVELRYGLIFSGDPQKKNGLTQQEVASRLGISRSYVSRIEKRALEKIRKAMESKK
ncbi:MAG: sigma-70 family RNA polymerase sigma factor [Clostridiales bacterium]|nr:sigma-70 family RNA polymerase sigma factor [Clostridiales bacterium]